MWFIKNNKKNIKSPEIIYKKEKIEEIVFPNINGPFVATVICDIHRELEDLAVTYVATCEAAGRNGAILINNAHIESWGITEEDLWQAAQDNFGNESYSIQGIADVLADKGYEDEFPPLEDVPMFVVSNKACFGGAAVIANTEFLNKILDKVGKNYFIIPSSIHEILCIPDDGNTDAYALREMIREVNDTTVEPEEVLSYNPYYFSEEGLKIAS